MRYICLVRKQSCGIFASSENSHAVYLPLPKIVMRYICLFRKQSCGIFASSENSHAVYLPLPKIVMRYICLFLNFCVLLTAGKESASNPFCFKRFVLRIPVYTACNVFVWFHRSNFSWAWYMEFRALLQNATTPAGCCGPLWLTESPLLPSS